MVRLQLITIIICGFVGFSPLSAQCVQFDVAHTVAAQDVTTPEFQTNYPDEKLIRIQLPISSLIRMETEASLLQYLYVISGTTSHAFQVVDYAPRTTLMTDVNGLISTESSDDQSTTIGISAFSPHEFPVKTDATAKHSTGTRAAERMERLPPKQLLSASGTMHRGLSAYFKLKPSTQTTLEGDKMFEVTARVRQGWRASLLHVTCAAFAKARGGFSDASDVVCGQRAFIVGVYSAGDVMAKQSVERLASTQYQLRQLAKKHEQTIAENRYPSFGHKLGAAFSMVKPKIPDQWLQELLTSEDFHSFERHLPRPIRTAATEYRQARTQVIRFAG